MAFNVEDIEKYNSIAQNVVKEIRKHKVSGNYKSVTYEFRTVQVNETTTEIFLDVVGKDAKGNKKVLSSYHALEFIKKDENYSRTTNVIKTEEKEM